MQSLAQATSTCLQRVAGLPKAEAYSALCTSVESLSEHQREADLKIVELMQENERLKGNGQGVGSLLQRQSEQARNAELQQSLAEANKEIAELRSKHEQLKADAKRRETALANAAEGR